MASDGWAAGPDPHDRGAVGDAIFLASLDFRRQLEAALESPNAGPVHVLHLDVDDVKELNDSLGVEAGDAVLIEVGRRLLECVGPEVTASRLGGDEFVVVLAGATHADELAARIVRVLNAPFRVQGTELRPSVSLGLAGNGDQQLRASDLLRRATVAMYAAKAAGKNRYLNFSPNMMSALVVRGDRETALSHAVERHEIVVHYQPIVNVSAGRTTEFEALARWNHAGALIPPGEFVPVAEASGLINPIGREVLALACAQLRNWLVGDDARSVAVNVSAVQLRETTFARDVLDVLATVGVDPRQLVLEITESAFLDETPRVIKQLSLVRAPGIRVSLDDFGTGYSSLGRLQELPVDIIKIDRSFVSPIKTGDEALPILNSIIDLAHNLGMHVTAEGVESAVQALHLHRLGCDSLQGYYFGRPTAIDSLADSERAATDAYRKLM